MLVLLGGLGLAVILLLVLVITNFNNQKTPKSLTETIYLRITNLQTTAKKYHPQLKSSALRATNASLNTQLTNINRDISAQFSALDIKKDKIDKKLKATETDRIDQANKSLETARLNVRLDRTYAKEMTFQVNMLVTLIQQTAKKAKKDYKTTLELAAKDFQTIANQFAAYSDNES
jgi:hypothetical protein